MKPLIGINLDVQPGTPEQFVLNPAYAQAVQAAGGVPLIIAPMSDDDLTDLLSVVSGIIFTGGKDYMPDLYGHSLHANVDLAHSWRQEFDIRLMHKCLQETRLPILGICAGHQLLNIALGGTLIQDLDSEIFAPTTVNHMNACSSSTLSPHEVEVERSTNLGHIFPTARLTVPSAHHQAVKRLGAGLRVSSRADDDVVESIELQDRGFTIGVQWHPERDFKGQNPLFEAFVAAASGF